MKNEAKKICEDPSFRREITNLLYRITDVDTSPAPDVSASRVNEEKCFGIIREYIAGIPLENGVIRREPISPAIESHEAYTRPYYTASKENPEGLDPRRAYEGRYNLLYMADRDPAPGGRGAGLNAHIDTVAPFFPPKIDGDFMYGRGSCDDKANVAVILGALKLLGIMESKKLVELKNTITAMFVIDEETGGNGSLSLALSETVRQRCGSVLVLEACDRNVHPANRGAVWFKCVFSPGAGGDSTGTNLHEAAASAVLEMQREGEKIKSESDHPLFPHRPVQTCNGILGPFGEHPSRICGEVSFRVKSGGAEPVPGLEKALEKGAERFVRKHGDKTLIEDPVTGGPKVDRHYSLRREGADTLVTVYGSTGHMGAILENDDAIVKWAIMMDELSELSKECPFETELEGLPNPAELVLEGGQGFLPTHTIGEVQERMRQAALRATKHYLRGAGRGEDEISVETTYDKLHNAAFDCDPDSETVKNALSAAEKAGLRKEGEPLRGWDVSCDARLFAGLGIPVVTSGAGELKSAHSNNEYVKIPDVLSLILFTALFLLMETGAQKA